MRLVYKETGNPSRPAGSEVMVGDIVKTSRDELVEVKYFREPHKASSSGKVSVSTAEFPDRSSEFYVGVIGAEWIDREDRRPSAMDLG